MSQAIINETTLSNLADVTRNLMSDSETRTPDECVSDLSGIMVKGTSKYVGDVTWSTQITLRDIAVNRFALIDVANQTDMANMFYYCRNLSSLSLPEGFGAQATTLSTCFKQCTSLSALSLPKGFGAEATNMFGMFESCSSLTSLNFPEGFGAEVTKTSQMFYKCSSLSSLVLPEGFGAEATNIRYMFANCSSLV